ncbi:MAG: SHOCT domain-containing protein [Desulfobacteraceae bacterium]|nr:MAG: SHOCT domain-containing protein [Desulfobacteraceae bacterium]
MQTRRLLALTGRKSKGRRYIRKEVLVMRRFSATLISIGISAALIAAGIWFLSGQSGAYPYGSGRWHMPYGMMMGGGMGVVMILFWLIVLAALILLISGIVSNRRTAAPGVDNEPDALEIVKRRYARGEIDTAEYESKRRELQK